jgi:hypothetical protein
MNALEVYSTLIGYKWTSVNGGSIFSINFFPEIFYPYFANGIIPPFNKKTPPIWRGDTGEGEGYQGVIGDRTTPTSQTSYIPPLMV